jgi:hypothetical protein
MIALLGLLLCGGVLADVFVSSMSGNDSATCGATATAPCRSVAFAVARARANEQVVLAANEEYRFDDASACVLITFNVSFVCATGVAKLIGSAFPFFRVNGSAVLDVAFEGLSFDGTESNVSTSFMFESSGVSLHRLAFARSDFVNFHNNSGTAVSISGDFAADPAHAPFEFEFSLRNVSIRDCTGANFLLQVESTLATNISLVDVSVTNVTCIGAVVAITSSANATVVGERIELADITFEPTAMSFTMPLLTIVSLEALKAQFRDVHVRNVFKFVGSGAQQGIWLRGGEESHLSIASSSFQDVFCTAIHLTRILSDKIVVDVTTGFVVELADLTFENARYVVADCAAFVIVDEEGFPGSHDVGVTQALVENVVFVGQGGELCSLDSFSPPGGGLLFDFSLQARAYDPNVVVVRNCSFERLRATSGGAIQMNKGPNCLDFLIDDCHFDDNRAHFSGGAVSFVGLFAGACAQDEPFVINRSTFSRNAAIQGGAVAVNVFDPRGELTLPSPCSVAIHESTFERNFASEGADHIFASVVMSLLLVNSTIVGGQQPISAMAGFVLPAGNISLLSTSVACDSGHFASLVSSVLREQTSRLARMTLSCPMCLVGTFNLAGQIALFDGAGNLSSPIGASGCHACPPGSRFNCSGASLGAAMQHWAAKPAPQALGEVAFARCPPNFCCDQPGGCAATDECAHQRTGVLCSTCADGFALGVSFQDKCLDVATMCTRTRIAVGLVVFLAAAGALTATQLFANHGRTDGLKSVLLSFANTAAILARELADAAPDDGASQLHSVVSLASGIGVPLTEATAVCITPALSSLERILVPLGVLGAMLVWHLLGSVAILLQSRRQRRTTRPHDVDLAAEADDNDDVPAASQSPNDAALLRIVSAFLALLDFNLFIVVGVLVNLLVTVTIPGLGCRLWRAGDQSCGGWQAFVVVALVVTLLAPLLTELVVRKRPHSLAARAVLLVFRASAATTSNGAQAYHLASTYRRVALALVSTFITDIDDRLAAIRAVLMVAGAWLVFLGAPFKSALVNRLEWFALSVALCVALSLSSDHTKPRPVLRTVQVIALALVIALLVSAIVVTWIVAKLRKRRAK